MGQQSSILCVDDEHTALFLRTRVLQKAGFEVVPVSSAAQALDVINSRPVDLVLTDHLMPDVSGAELAREVKARRPHVPVVLLSGGNELPTEASCVDLFLSKLEGPAVLCEKISELVAKSQKASIASS